MSEKLEELEMSGLVQFLEPIIKQSLEGIEIALSLPSTEEEIKDLKILILQLKEEISTYGDIFSVDIRGKIIEINDRLDIMTQVGI